jgi:hypothetical protein
MPGTITAIDASDHLFVLGETLRPLLTNAMGSSLEIFDTSGPAGAGPPRTATRGRRRTWSSTVSSR